MREIILVPLDGSEVAESILPYIKDVISKLASDVKVKIILLQVLEEHYYSYGDDVMPYLAVVPFTKDRTEADRGKAFNYLGEVAQKLVEKGVRVAIKVEFGDAAHQIARVAKKSRVNMIAMSTHGRSGLARLVLGSTTDKLLHITTKIPITVVRVPKESLRNK
ncbi:MAG: universal stress protein [Chloroflexota bacterium]